MKRQLLSALLGGGLILSVGGCSFKSEPTAQTRPCQPYAQTQPCQPPAPQQVAVQAPEPAKAPEPKKEEKPANPCDGMTLAPQCDLHFRVIGQGVAPVNTVSPAQAMALAKRAAIADGYRQLAEKISGVYVEGRDMIKNMMVQNSVVHTQVNALIRNAEIVDTEFRDGLYQAQMEITIHGGKWYEKLAN